MRTISFVSSKGGPGKTTLAASVGVAAMQAGERPFLVDLDPQGSLSSWGERRKAESPPVDRIAPDKLAAALRALAGAGYTLAVLDTVGIDTATTTEAMRSADLSLIPCRPSRLDLEAARPILAALTRLDRPYSFILNACPPGHSTRLDDAGRALSLLLANPPVVQRTDHVDAIGFGLGVTELDPEGKAAAEIRQLWAWIEHRMENRHGEASALA